MVGVSAHIVPRHRRWPLTLLRSRPLTSHRESSECHRREGELHPRRCWPMWRCRSSTTTKQRWTRRQKGLPNYRLFRVCGRLCATNVDGSFQFIDDIRNLEGQRGSRPQRAVIVEHRDALKFRHKLGRVSLVTRSTNSMIDRFAAVSFQNDNADIFSHRIDPACASRDCFSATPPLCDRLRPAATPQSRPVRLVGVQISRFGMARARPHRAPYREAPPSTMNAVHPERAGLAGHLLIVIQVAFCSPDPSRSSREGWTCWPSPHRYPGGLLLTRP